MRRILFLGSDLSAASWRFRVAQYLPHLRQLGIAADVVDLRQSLPQRLRALAAARHYDAVCVHRVLLPAFEHYWLHRAAPRYAFDFDDAVMLRDSAAARFDSWQRRRRFARMVRGAGAVIAGNQYLAGWASRYRRDVRVIPTAVDLTAYPPALPDVRAAVVGWMGTRPNLPYLRHVLPALRRLAALRPDLRLQVVCDDDFAAPQLNLTSKRWSRTEEVADLRGFSVGIMPLPDDPWTRGKCALKILQYHAAGVPVVCAPVGANRDVVEDGVSGFFAESEDEWVARLDALLGDAELRRRFATRGRDIVRQRYCLEVTLPPLVDALLGARAARPHK